MVKEEKCSSDEKDQSSQEDCKDGRSRNFSCDRCLKKFFARRHRNRHIEQVHDRIKRYTCQECGSSFYSESNLRMHHQMHMNPNKRDKFQCKECNKSYFTRGGLATHVKTHHEYHQELTCSWPACHYNAPKQSHLRVHVDSVRKKLYQYPCPLKKDGGCEKVFKLKNAADSHFRRIHLNKRVPCPLASCNQTFSKEDVARTHYRRVHEGDTARWRCPHCSKLLSFSSVLLRHIKRAHQKIRK